MEGQQPVLFGQRRLAGRAFVEWFTDLARGDLVAWTLCLALVAFFAVIAAFGAWFLYQRKISMDAFKKRVAEKRKKEDTQYKASKKTKEI